MYFAFLLKKKAMLKTTWLKEFIRNEKSAAYPQGIQNFQDHYSINSVFCLANGSLGKVLTCYHDTPCQSFAPIISISSAEHCSALPIQLRSHQRLFLPFHQHSNLSKSNKKRESPPKQGLSHSEI